METVSFLYDCNWLVFSIAVFRVAQGKFFNLSALLSATDVCVTKSKDGLIKHIMVLMTATHVLLV